jgi:hypothetical protein
MNLKIICTVLHCINLVIGAAIASGYNAQWLGFALLATAALDGYLTTQIPTTAPSK